MMDVYNVLGKIFDSWFIYLNDGGIISDIKLILAVYVIVCLKD